MNTMNPYEVYLMVALIIAGGFLFIMYIEWRDKHITSE